MPYYLFLFLLLATSQIFAQSTDTLFYKNFDDNNLRSTLPGNKGSFTPSNSGQSIYTPNQSYGINATSGMATDLGSIRLEYRVRFGTPSNIAYNLFTIQTSLSDMDSLWVSFSVKANTVDTSYKNTTYVLSESSSIPLQYLNAVTNKSFFKTYNVVFLPASYPANLLTSDLKSFADAQLSNDRAQMRIRYAYSVRNQTSFSFSLNAQEAISQNVIIPNLNPPGSMIAESAIRQTLVNDFCATTDNPSDCAAKVSFAPPISNANLSQDLLIDDILIVGKKSTLTTALEPSLPLSVENPIVKAYTFTGQEIADFGNYHGMAIVVYKNGSRAKVLR